MIGSKIGGRIATPLLQLTDAARQVAAGRFNEPLTIRLNDEVGILASTFNRMSTDLQESRSQVEKTNQELEERIKERTEELRQKNIALEMQTERALDASRLKSSFLANVSHELRTPLNAILALSELLKDGLAGELTEEQSSHVTMIHRSGTGLLRLINDVLDLSKIEAGRMELQIAACDIMNDLRKAAAEMHPLASSKGLDLRIRIDGGPRVLIRIARQILTTFSAARSTTERGYIGSARRSTPIAGNLDLGPDTGIDRPRTFKGISSSAKLTDPHPGASGLPVVDFSGWPDDGGRITVESALGRGPFPCDSACRVGR
jgi:hypothetical protein